MANKNTQLTGAQYMSELASALQNEYARKGTSAKIDEYNRTTTAKQVPATTQITVGGKNLTVPTSGTLRGHSYDLSNPKGTAGGIELFQDPESENIVKIILGTAGDAAVDLGKGITRFSEGIADSILYGIGDAAKLFGYTDADLRDFRRRTAASTTDHIFGGVDNYLGQHSVLGRTSDAILEGAGQAAAIVGLGGFGAGAGLGTAGTTALTTGASFVSGAGSGRGEAYQGGATDAEARTYGVISGAADAITELIFGGLGKGVKAFGIGRGLTSADDMLAKTLGNKVTKALSKVISNEKVLRAIGNTTELGVKMSAEGVEEVLAGLAQAVGKKITYMSKEDLGKIIQDENLLEQFLVGAATSGIMQGGDVHRANRGNVDLVTGLTQNEHAVVEQEVKNRIVQEQKGGKKLSGKEKSAIYEQVVKDMERGYISTETIESVLGKDALAQHDTLSKEAEEFKTLYETEGGKLSEKQKDRLAELKEKNKSNPYEQLLKSQREKISKDVSALAQNDRLGESYREQTRKGEKFQADVSKYSEAQRKTVQNAIDSGILNNTNRSHEFVDLIAKISADKGISFDFADNAKLKESGFALDGVLVNGFVNENGVTINIQSAKALNRVVGHEITHVLEGTELYDALQSAVTEYAKGKKEYDSRLKELTELYKGKNANVEQELVADLVGDYLFTDADFIKHLSTANRNLFQKIYDEIKYLCKIVTAGTKEARQLEKVKKAFADAYRAETKNPTADGGTRYSIGNIVGVSSKNYGVGVSLDSTLLSNLTEDERIDMVKEYVKELGGSVFTAYDNNHNAVDVHIVESNKKFKNKSGKRVPVTKDLTSYLKSEVKQEAIALIDELVLASSYEGKEPATHPHDWLDDNGTNDWDLWKTYIQDKQNTVWEASLRIANSTNGEKILYDIFPIKMVEGAGTSATTTTNNNIAPNKQSVNNQNSLSKKDFSIAPHVGADVHGKDIGYDIAPPIPESVLRANKARPKVGDPAYAPVAEGYVKQVQQGAAQAGKQRKWVTTSTESDAVNRQILPDELDATKITYEPVSNKKTLGNANAKLETIGYDGAVEYFNNQIYADKVSLDDIALGERLIQEAIKMGDTVNAGELIQNIAILGTELGQKVQALSIIQRLTPEGQLKMLQKIVNRGKAKGDNTFNGVEITQDMIDHILSVYGKDGSYDQNNLNRAVEEVKQQIADQMTVTKMEKVNGWRYLSMLGNPKTHIRNILSNLANMGTIAVKDTVARTIESVIPADQRTKTWKPASNDVKDFAKKTTAEMKDQITGEGKYNDTSDIKAKRDTFNTKVLQRVYGFNSDLLSKEDWWFSKPAFKQSFQEFLTANGVETAQDIQNNPKLVEKAKKYALERAEIATFRQASWLASKLSSLEKKNTATQVIFGSVIPFKKTPINVAKAGLSYSPLGFAKTLTYDIVQVKKGNMAASELVDHLAQNLTGTGLALVGYWLARIGFLNGAGEDDKEETYDSYLGEQAYSVNIGENTYSLSWLSPTAMPLFVGANLYEQLVEGKEWNADVVLETLAQTLDPMSEMSFLSSLDDVLSSYDSGMEKFAGIGVSALSSYASQFIPTALSQTAATIDDTKRTTKVAANSGSKVIDEVVNQMMYKIPLLRQLLQPSTDIWGNEIKQSENVAVRALENFVAPWSRKGNISSAVDDELKELYSEVGEDGILPGIPENTVTYKGKKYPMSAAEFTAYKETYGQTAYKQLEKLFQTATYRNAAPVDQAELVSEVYKYASDVAKREYLAGRDVEYTNTTKDNVPIYKENAIKGAIENDMIPEEYDLYRTDYPQYTVSKAVGGYEAYKGYRKDLSNIKADKDQNGETIDGSRKQKVQAYINGLDAGYYEKLILWKREYPSDDSYNAEIINYLNSRTDISQTEMKTILEELGFKVSASGKSAWD